MRVRTRLDRMERRLRAVGSTDTGPTVQQVVNPIDTDPAFPSVEWIELHRKLCLRQECEPDRETESLLSAITALEPEFEACMARLQARINAPDIDCLGSDGCVPSHDG